MHLDCTQNLLGACTCKGRKCEKVMRGGLTPASSSSIYMFSARLLSAGSFRLSKYSAMDVSCELGMCGGHWHAWKSTITWNAHP